MQKFPVHEELEIVDGHTIYKHGQWWKAVVLIDGFQGLEVSVYLWKKKDGEWKRQQKFKVKDVDEWEVTKGIIDSFLEQMSQE